MKKSWDDILKSMGLLILSNHTPKGCLSDESLNIFFSTDMFKNKVCLHSVMAGDNGLFDVVCGAALTFFLILGGREIYRSFKRFQEDTRPIETPAVREMNYHGSCMWRDYVDSNPDRVNYVDFYKAGRD